MSKYSVVRWRSPAGIALLVFLAVITFFLITEHLALVIPVLPWLLFLLCPLMHLFMMHGHGDHGSHDHGSHDHLTGGPR